VGLRPVMRLRRGIPIPFPKGGAGRTTPRFSSVPRGGFDRGENTVEREAPHMGLLVQAERSELS